jgi:hypothetical protein
MTETAINYSEMIRFTHGIHDHSRGATFPHSCAQMLNFKDEAAWKGALFRGVFNER